MSTTTKPVARYFPLTSGQYVVKPGFYRLGHDFGNGAADTRVFQLDRQFADYHRAKQHARQENPAKYICVADYRDEQDRLISHHILRQLCHEYPESFHLQTDARRQRLGCRLTGESLHFSAAGEYLQGASATGARLPYTHGLDALAMQLQEDLAVVSLGEDMDILSAVHICLPNHWDPRDKVGKDFVAVHSPVPGMAQINARARQLLQACLYQGPYVRFAWGVASDDRLNHHPEPPPAIVPEHWRGREFDARNPGAWLRVERQVLYGLPEIQSVLFTIRTYHYPVAALSATQQHRLYQAITQMDQATLDYKGLTAQQQRLLNWLQSLSTAS